MGSGSEVGFIIPTPEQNYKNLMEIANGIKSVKVSELHKSEVLSLESESNLESLPYTVDVVPEQKEIKIESPDIIREQMVDEPKEKVELKEKYSEKQVIGEPKVEKVSEKKELSHISEEKLRRFPFKPFAETARAVGIPAHSSYEVKSELYTSFNGVLDSTTLLELYYFDYDKLVVNRSIFYGEEDSWISKSLLSLIYKSEQEEPLSFLMLGYGIVSTHWQSFMPEEDLDTPEIVVEEMIQEHDPIRGDIIFDK
ncbi:uncharacterized protein ELE39_002533 [Cryptosporidium sp. chipmunk genotype I]|uniref:uncharacterized protein n=1 Tax=Cryptosporidium sp. chipmunk genotype I TaxID=1280935 RepID=UPI00351AA8A9|nr:hypothetical protein ELE39_002533 [Cryptosporidium sp. chipmunk genotype I]